MNLNAYVSWSYLFCVCFLMGTQSVMLWFLPSLKCLSQKGDHWISYVFCIPPEFLSCDLPSNVFFYFPFPMIAVSVVMIAVEIYKMLLESVELDLLCLFLLYCLLPNIKRNIFQDHTTAICVEHLHRVLLYCNIFSLSCIIMNLQFRSHTVSCKKSAFSKSVIFETI